MGTTSHKFAIWQKLLFLNWQAETEIALKSDSVVSPVVYRPAYHPHAVIREWGDGEAGDQRERVEGGHKHLAQTLVPLVVGVLPAKRYHAVHGDGDGHVEDVRARQRADEELQRLPLFLLGADAKDAPSVGQDGYPRADQPSQRVGVDDIILHGGYLIHHVGAGKGRAWGAARNCRQEQVHTRRRKRWWRAGGDAGLQARQASYLGGRALSMGWPQQGKDAVAVRLSGMSEGRMEEPSQFPYKAKAGEGEREKRDSETVQFKITLHHT